MRPGVLKRMGLDHDSLAAERPDIITMSLSGFGEAGPLASLPGFDMVMQGFSGIMMAQGDATEPVAQTVAYVDVTTACMNVLGCMLGLVHRQRSGEGQHVWNSLIGTATFLQTAELVRYEGRPAPRQGHPDFRGSEWHDRYYGAADGWVRIDTCGDAATALVALRELGWVSRDAAEPAQIEAALHAVIGGLTAAAATALLNRVGVPSVLTRKVSQLFADPQLMASEFAHFSQSVDGYLMSMPGRYATFSRTQRWGPMKPPGLGEHSRAVLDRAGFATDEIDHFIKTGIVGEGGPMPTRFGATYR
jgi:crotonobetainyl-CoA:carnitine CoA-transferase CaiB-like acyl-CoA transferase